MINVDLGVRIESLGDATPAAPVVKTKSLYLSDPLTQPLEDPLTAEPLTPTPDVSPTALKVDPAITWRDDSRFHQIAADHLGLRHL